MDELKTQLSINNDDEYSKLMKTIWGEINPNENVEPKLKFKWGKILYVLWDNEQEFEKLEWVRVIFKTWFYQLSETVDGKTTTLWSSNEYIQWEWFFWFDKESNEKKRFGSWKELREYLWDLVKPKELKFMNVVYFDIPEYGIVKSYLKLSKTVWVTKEKDWTTMYHFKDPFEWMLWAMEAKYKWGLSDMVFSLSTKTYVYWDTATTCYPVLSEEKLEKDPEIVKKTLDIINNIKKSISARVARADEDVEELTIESVEVVEWDAASSPADDIPF